MIEFKTGDMFTTALPAIGHGVNIMGVMGSGIAPIIRGKYPAVFPPYVRACKAGTLTPGEMLPVEVLPGFWVLNLASQDKTGANARLEWLEQSVREAFLYCDAEGLPGFALPRIGAGIGGLQWKDVKQTLIRVSNDFPHITLEVWSLPNAPE